MALRRREMAAVDLFSTVQTVKLEHACAEPCLMRRNRQVDGDAREYDNRTCRDTHSRPAKIASHAA